MRVEKGRSGTMQRTMEREGVGGLRALRQRWGGLAALAVGALGGGYIILRGAWEPAYALRWTAAAGVAMAYQLWWLWGVLDENHREGEMEVLPSFGAGNALSLLRGLLIGLLVGFLFGPRPTGWLAWAPAVLYVISDVTDYLDGYLARVSDHVTRLGETLDIVLDARGVLVVTLLAFHYGSVPWWYLPVGAARYLFVWGI